MHSIVLLLASPGCHLVEDTKGLSLGLDISITTVTVLTLRQCPHMAANPQPFDRWRSGRCPLKFSSTVGLRIGVADRYLEPQPGPWGRDSAIR